MILTNEDKEYNINVFSEKEEIDSVLKHYAHHYQLE